jgi:hypothetical protein
MTSAVLFELLNFDTSSDGIASHKRRRRRLPVPLVVERLEDRTVPDANINFNGPLTLVTLNPQPIDQFSPLFTATPALAAGVGVGSQNVPLLTISGVNSVGPSTGLIDLFGPNAVNSSGPTSPSSRSWVPDAFGFGSGTQPGEPWAPAYMNLGLANQQNQQVLPWGRTITYGQASGARADGGNQAAPGGGGAAPQPGDANRPDNRNQPDAPKQNKEDGKKEQKEEGPKNADQKDKGPKKADPNKKDQKNEQPKSANPQEQLSSDKPDGTKGPSSQLIPDRSGAIFGTDADERMTTIDRILTGSKGDEEDGALLDGVSLTDPTVLSGSLLLSSAYSGPFSALLPTAASQPTSDEGFAGGADGEGMNGSE